MSSPNSSASSYSSNREITVKEILDRYSDDPDLLKYILTAKSEEDKAIAARDILKTEEARIYARQLELDILQEQSYTKYPKISHNKVMEALKAKITKNRRLSLE